MESSEASVSTQDQLATAVLQTAMKQHLEQYRQQILAEVSDQMRAVDSRISAVDSRISSVAEATSQTQKDVARLESRADTESVKRDAQYQDLTDKVQAGFQALMTAMAAMSSKDKDT